MGLRPDTECFDCFRRGFSDYVHRAGLTEKHLDRYMKLIEENLRKDTVPPLAGAEAWAALRKASQNGEDIFLLEKKSFTEKLLEVYHELRTLFLGEDDPASAALSAATWCNLLDVGQGRPLPEIPDLIKLFTKPLEIDERHIFLEELRDAGSLLVLGDNSGETVLDRLFLELSGFQGKRFYMTREEPVMNDATLTDARQAGLHQEATLISSGCDVPAVIPELLTGERLELFHSSDIILAKGQGNLEGLFGSGDPRVYHSFVVKCPVVSRAVKADTGAGIFSRFLNMEA